MFLREEQQGSGMCKCKINALAALIEHIFTKLPTSAGTQLYQLPHYLGQQHCFSFSFGEMHLGV